MSMITDTIMSMPANLCRIHIKPLEGAMPTLVVGMLRSNRRQDMPT